MKTLAHYVSLQVMQLAGFNYHETSLGVEKEGKNYDVHISNHVKDNHLVIIYPTFGRQLYYFRCFQAKALGDDSLTPEEEEAFHDLLKETISPPYRVAARNLERRLLEEVRRIEIGAYGRSTIEH
jgi:hypothetical protein